MSQQSYKIFIIAGEQSGDLIGAKLMSDLKKIAKVDFYGIGGYQMTQQGIKTIFPMSDINLIGFVEILPHIFKILRRINLTAKKIEEIKPNAIITIDSPGFSFRLAKKIKRLGIPLFHYVAPTVWAYKPKRAKKIAQIYDHLFTLLPFENEYFEKENLACTFVGHPLTQDKIGDNEKFRNKFNLQNKFILCLCPGSRKSEIKQLLGIFLTTAQLLSNEIKNMAIVIPTFPHLKSLIENKIKSIHNFKIIICDDINLHKDLIASSNLALAKCGTITNEFAFAKIPLITAYKVNFITAWILKKLIKIPYVSLINIISNQEIIPEYLQEKCTSKNLHNALLKLYRNDNLRKKQIENFEFALNQLTNKNNVPPSELAAKNIIELLK